MLFQCRYMSGIPTPTVSWSRDGGGLMPSNAEVLSGGVLRINSVTGSEEGGYTCRAENAAGHVEMTAQLTVNVLPTVSLDPASSVVMMLGSRLEIKCRVQGDPVPTISWRKMSK